MFAHKSSIATQQQTPNSSHIFSTNHKQLTSIPATPLGIKPEQIASRLQIQSQQKQVLIQQQNTNIALNIMYENQVLKEENKVLKKQLSLFTKQSQFQGGQFSHYDGHQHMSQSSNGKSASRNTDGQNRQLRDWVATLRKQCEMYQDIITKMDSKITSLQSQNKNMATQLKISQLQKSDIQKSLTILKMESTSKQSQIEQNHKNEIKQLKQKINSVMNLYSELQKQFNRNQLEWVMWRQKFNKEKSEYVEKIKEMDRVIKAMMVSMGKNKNKVNYDEKQQQKYNHKFYSMNISINQSDSKNNNVRYAPLHTEKSNNNNNNNNNNDSNYNYNGDSITMTNYSTRPRNWSNSNSNINNNKNYHNNNIMNISGSPTANTRRGQQKQRYISRQRQNNVSGNINVSKSKSKSKSKQKSIQKYFNRKY